MNPEQCDVIVIGGGPGGSTVSTLLAEKGFSVILFEKDEHPRFHVGESLLPSNLPLFKRLGILPEIAKIGLPKYGAEFNTPDGEERTTFYFREEENYEYPPAYEVPRAELDAILINNASSKGVKVKQSTKVVSVAFQGDEGNLVVAEGPGAQKSEYKTSFVIDSSGQETFLAKNFKMKNRNRRHASAAVLAHFRNVERLEGKDEGNISIFWFKYGWFWAIPLKDGITSVGAVCWPQYLKTRGNQTLEQFLMSTIQLCPNLAKRMKGAEFVNPARAVSNYSYRARKSYGRNYLLIGDAFTFLDPIFSSGVYVAMRSAFDAAEAVQECLGNPELAEKRLRRHELFVSRGLNHLSWLILRITSPTMMDLFLHPRNPFGVRDLIVSILAGKFFELRGTNFTYSLFKSIYYFKVAANLQEHLKWRSEKAGLAG